MCHFLRRRTVEAQFEGFAFEYEGIQRIKKTLLLNGWVAGEPTRRIESDFHCFSGNVSGMSVEFAWLAETLCELAKAKEWPKDAVEALSTLSRQLVFGVPAAGVKLASARVKGLGRGRIAALIKADLTELEKILSEPVESLGKIVTRPVAERLRKRAEEILQVEKASKEEGSAPVDEETGEPPASPEYQEWPKEFPPSDPMGAMYLSDARIHLDGRAKKRRHLMTIDGKEVWLTERSFGAALRLALAAKTSPLGWLDCDHLGSIDGYHQVIRRLKKALKASGVDVDRLVENNGAKQYRFSLPPGNITLDEAVIRRHVTGSKKLLDTISSGQ